MTENGLLLNLLENILGKGKSRARNNYAFMCPNGCHSSKPKLEINLETEQWACWKCVKFKGKKLIGLFKKLKVSPDKIQELKSYTGNTNYKIKNPTEEQVLELPKEYKTLNNATDLIARHALNYLRKRGLTKNDIIKYQLGYCESGKYKNMIILPSFDSEGKLNYFTGRSFEEEMTGEKPFISYVNPINSRNIIPFELYINWNLPITICEGIFDAIAIKRNAIPLLGKNIQSNLLKKLIGSNVKKIYIALDKDAIKQSIEHCELLMNEGKEIYLVDLEDKDPSKIGHRGFINIISQTLPLDYSGLMSKKLEMI